MGSTAELGTVRSGQQLAAVMRTGDTVLRCGLHLCLPRRRKERCAGSVVVASVEDGGAVDAVKMEATASAEEARPSLVMRA